MVKSLNWGNKFTSRKRKNIRYQRTTVNFVILK